MSSSILRRMNNWSFVVRLFTFQKRTVVRVADIRHEKLRVDRHVYRIRRILKGQLRQQADHI
jgi:hypothetical protein